MGTGKSKDGGDGNRPRQNSDSLHRLEKELEREAARNAPPVEDLPEEYKEKLTKCGIELPDANKHLDAVLNILHFLYKRRFKRKQAPPKTKKRRKSQNRNSDVKSRLAEVAAEESGSTGLSDSQGPNDKPEKGSPAIGRSEGAGSKGATDTPNETEKDVKKGDEEEELTPEELEIEQRIVLKGDPVKLFKSFQAHGSGGFGTVERAKHIETKTQVAVKHVPHKTIKQRKTNIQEISFLKALKGKKNVVEYFGTYAHNEELWIVMEFMEGGTLAQALKAWTFKEPQIAYFAREVLRGLNSLHEVNCAHRDIKPHNIMLDVDGIVKLIDFGLCIDFNKTPDPRNMVGSAYWMAPEMIARKPHGCKVDIFSLGMVIYELMAGEPLTTLFKPLQAMYYNVTHGGPPTSHLAKRPERAKEGDWSPEIMDFLKQCLTRNPDKRPAAKDLLNHPFLKVADEPAEMKRILKLIFLSNSLQMQGIGI